MYCGVSLSRPRYPVDRLSFSFWVNITYDMSLDGFRKFNFIINLDIVEGYIQSSLPYVTLSPHTHLQHMEHLNAGKNRDLPTNY